MIYKTSGEYEVYPLDDLVPAGTLQFDVCPEVFDELTSCGNAADDLGLGAYSEWETLECALERSNKKDDLTVPQYIKFIKLSFLVKHSYVRSQWKLFLDNILHIRIHLIPLDHPANPRKFLPKPPQGVAKNARDYLSTLLCDINRAPQAWDQPVSASDQFKPFLSASESITLNEIFSNLPPPQAQPSSFLQNVDLRTKKLYSKALTWDKPPGIKTKLYKYQVRTVASMIQREAQSLSIPDPSYIQHHGADKRLFYLHPSSMEALRGPLPQYSVPNGGILCEEMGTGKTCIVLGLIMATKDHLAQPEDGWNVAEKNILSELALRTFPFPAFETAREYASQPVSLESPPSLRELLIHYIRATPLVFTPENHQTLQRFPHHLKECLKNCVPFYRKDVTHKNEGLRTSIRKTPLKRRWRQFYLTAATLIVVPQSIVVQWNSEINKHCDTSAVRVLFLDDNLKTQEIPPAPKLASEYDIVLLTHERLSHSKMNKDQLIRETYCKCLKTTHRSPVPRCRCKENQCFPLMQVRWKRLVVDEGHKTGTRGNYAQKCQEFNAASRWVVSGTPTPNLMGLGLGLEKAETPEVEQHHSGEDAQDDYNSGDDEEPESSLARLSDNKSNIPQSRPWSKEERTDLSILGDYFSRFFSFGPYSDKSEFGENVIKAVMHRMGPLPGSITILRNIMALMMFRHPIQTIEMEIPEKLPILQEKIIKLKFQPLAARTYNVLQSVIAVNAVDSQREHQDYLFHPSSRKNLRTALENLSQTLFWKTDRDTFLIEEAIQHSEMALINAEKRKVSDLDLQLLRESLRIQKEAQEDITWTEIMSKEDFPFSIRGLSKPLIRTWSINPDFFDKCPLLNSDRLLALQHILHKLPLISEEKLVNQGYEQQRLEEERKAENPWASKPEEQFRRQSLGDKQNSRLSQNGGSSKQTNGLLTPVAISLDTCVPPIHLHKSTSSKVNYILRKVLKHSKGHKFLIFSSMPLSLAYLADALRLVQIRFLSYVSSEMSPRQRQTNAVTFETSEEYRVLLVELKLGSRGLNLVSASRIIFCEPVWHGDIESQAIKRAHRIGNTREKLKVVTLVMEGTHEEAMVSRRRALRNQVEQQASSFELDVNMRKVLENPKFLTEEHIKRGDDDPNVVDVPLVKRKRDSFDFEFRVEENVNIEQDQMELEVNNSISPVKKRRVHYAQ